MWWKKITAYDKKNKVDVMKKNKKFYVNKLESDEKNSESDEKK